MYLSSMSVKTILLRSCKFSVGKYIGRIEGASFFLIVLGQVIYGHGRKREIFYFLYFFFFFELGRGSGLEIGSVV